MPVTTTRPVQANIKFAGRNKIVIDLRCQSGNRLRLNLDDRQAQFTQLLIV